MTTLELLTRAHSDHIRLVIPDADATIAQSSSVAKFDNRPTWDNSKPRFDNRPSWDNWNKR